MCYKMDTKIWSRLPDVHHSISTLQALLTNSLLYLLLYEQPWCRRWGGEGGHSHFGVEFGGVGGFVGVLHDQGAGDVAACWGLVMGGGGGSGISSVGYLVLGLTAQGERVLVWAVRTWISSLSGRWAICLRLLVTHRCAGVWVEGVGRKETDRNRWRGAKMWSNSYICLSACQLSEQKKKKANRPTGRQSRQTERGWVTDKTVERWRGGGEEANWRDRWVGGGWARRKTWQSVSTHC